MLKNFYFIEREKKNMHTYRVRYIDESSYIVDFIVCTLFKVLDAWAKKKMHLKVQAGVRSSYDHIWASFYYFTVMLFVRLCYFQTRVKLCRTHISGDNFSLDFDQNAKDISTSIHFQFNFKWPYNCQILKRF